MNKTITILVIVVILAIAIGGYFFPNVKQIVQQTVVGGDVINANPNFSDGLRISGVSEKWAFGTIKLGANTAFWTNNTNYDVFADTTEMYVNGTASSTLQFNVGTSSTASLAYSTYVTATNPYSSLISSQQVATSTNYKVFTNTATSVLTGQASSTTIRVAKGQSVFFLVKDPYNANTATDQNYESATSSNRGYTVDWKLKYHYIGL